MELVFQERASKAIAEGYYTSTSKTRDYVENPYEYKTLMDLAEADPILSTACDLTVDLATYNGYSFIGDEFVVVEAQERFDTELDFDQVIDNILYQLLIYEDAYMELQWNESHTKVAKLSPLNTAEMKINYDDHGEVLNYVQVVEGKAGEKMEIYFDKDSVIYFRNRWIGNTVYSRNRFKAISRGFATKVYANNYLQKLFLNIPPKIAYFLKSQSQRHREDLIENVTRAKTNPGMDLFAQGEDFKAQILTPEIPAALLPILEFLRKEVLMVTRVPPHWVGILDGANRGIGENVVIPYETKIKKLQQKIASQINRELMPKLSLDAEFKWNAVSLLDEESVVRIMGQLKAVGLDADSVIEFARNHGLRLSEDAFIEMPPSMGSGQPSLQVQDESAPSRQRNNPKGTMNVNINKAGVSAEGKKKLDARKVM